MGALGDVTSMQLLAASHDEGAAITQGRENTDFKQCREDIGGWSYDHPAIRQVGDTKRNP